MPRRTWRIPFAAFAMTAGLLTAAGPASAATFIRGFSVVQGSTPMNSMTTKRTTLSCPTTPAKSVIGAAAFVSPTLPNLSLQSAGPFGQPAAFAAGETDSESASWRLNARAFCVLTTQNAPPKNGAASYLKAPAIVRRESANNSSPAKSVSATCPKGKTAISGGGRVSPPNIDVGLTSLHRVGTGSWGVSAHEVDATNAPWSVFASVICANVTTETATSDYASGFTSGSNFSPLSSNPLQSANRNCGGNWPTIGGGAVIEGATPGSPPPSDVILTASDPLASGWLAIARESDPTSQTWRILSAAVCAPFTAGPPA